MRKANWAEKHVIEMAGIPIDQATEREIELAGIALERRYYLDRAAIEFSRMLNLNKV